MPVLTITSLVEAFNQVNPQTGGGYGWNAGKHPRGAHGYFIAAGSQGTDVKRAQHALGAGATGQFDAQTEEAVRRFQRAHGLQVDGIIGAQTLAALLGDAKASNIRPAGLTAAQLKRFREVTSRNAATRVAGGARGARGRRGSSSRRSASTRGAAAAALGLPASGQIG